MKNTSKLQNLMIASMVICAAQMNFAERAYALSAKGTKAPNATVATPAPKAKPKPKQAAPSPVSNISSPNLTPINEIDRTPLAIDLCKATVKVNVDGPGHLKSVAIKGCARSLRFHTWTASKIPAGLMRGAAQKTFDADSNILSEFCSASFVTAEGVGFRAFSDDQHICAELADSRKQSIVISVTGVIDVPIQNVVEQDGDSIKLSPRIGSLGLPSEYNLGVDYMDIPEPLF